MLLGGCLFFLAGGLLLRERGVIEFFFESNLRRAIPPSSAKMQRKITSQLFHILHFSTHIHTVFVSTTR